VTDLLGVQGFNPGVEHIADTLLEFMVGLEGHGAALRKQALIEKVSSFPGQGVASSFTFGQVYGEILGAVRVMALSYSTITPARWTREFVTQSSKKSKAEKKNSLFLAAKELFPDHKIYKAWADAVLLAEYARRNA
jgi:crossover junction endodeoxyribonuclease RuvC